MADLTPIPADVDALVAKDTEGCCMNDAWRGRLCQYHMGYEEGIAALWDFLHPSHRPRTEGVPEAAWAGDRPAKRPPLGGDNASSTTMEEGA